MTPLALLHKVSSALNAQDVAYAVAGGLAASYYRAEPRLTNDVDIALAGQGDEACKELASEIIESIGYEVVKGLIPSLGHQDKTPLRLVIGRANKNTFQGSVDFLLPCLPWVNPAVLRAQNHLIDFGFAKLPTITVEDLVIAKAFSLSRDPERFQDLDDLKSIFLAENPLDLAYLVAELEKKDLSFPRVLDKYLPSALKRAAKKNRK